MVRCLVHARANHNKVGEGKGFRVLGLGLRVEGKGLGRLGVLGAGSGFVVTSEWDFEDISFSMLVWEGLPGTL